MRGGGGIRAGGLGGAEGPRGTLRLARSQASACPLLSDFHCTLVRPQGRCKQIPLPADLPACRTFSEAFS